VNNFSKSDGSITLAETESDLGINILVID